MDLLKLSGVLLIFLNLYQTTASDVGCRSISPLHHLYLASKTPYRVVESKSEKAIKFPNCEPTRIWMVLRHGTRRPSAKLITKMHERLPIIKTEILLNNEHKKGNLCPEVVENLKLWEPLTNYDNEKRLTHEGEDEMLFLSERFQNYFPELFADEYNNNTYKFRSTATQRTQESLFYFTVGLFDRKEAMHVWAPDPLHKDPILRFYKLCSKWRQQVKKNPESIIEVRKFLNSTKVIEMVIGVSKTLGLGHLLSFDDIHAMYMTCAFETAWDKTKESPWCSLFSDQDFQILEYSEDLDYYWTDGYGYDVNHEQASPLLRDMFLQLAGANGTHAKTFYFTHSGTILKFLSHLGLYKDKDKLRHDQLNPDRLWKVGKIDAFGSNIAFVLFECADGPKVLTLHQERVVRLPGCKSSLCDFTSLFKIYKKSIDSSFKEICEN